MPRTEQYIEPFGGSAAVLINRNPSPVEIVSLIPDVQMDILRYLNESPSHGYQLHKDVGVATSTIYEHLSELEDAGMVESYEIEEDTRGKTEYRITEKGTQLLELLEE